VIITRYLVREVFSTLSGVLLVLLLIAFSGQLVGLFSKVAEGTLQADTVMTLFGVYSLTLVPFVLPLALYLAILMALSRLYANSEITVLEACGYGPWNLLRPVLLVAVIVAAVQGGFTLVLAPWGDAQGERLEKLERKSLSIEGITPGRFRSLPEGRGVIYAERINADRTRIENVFAQIRQRGHESLLVAEAGFLEANPQTGERYLVLLNGHRYEGRPGQDEFAVIGFDRHGLRMNPPQDRHIRYHQRAIPTPALWAGRAQRAHLVELQWRIASALMCLALALLAVPLSRTRPRGGRYGRLALAFLLYLLVNNLLNIARTWLDEGVAPAWVGMWWVPILTGVVGLVFIGWQVAGHRRLRRKEA